MLRGMFFGDGVLRLSVVAPSSYSPNGILWFIFRIVTQLFFPHDCFVVIFVVSWWLEGIMSVVAPQVCDNHHQVSGQSPSPGSSSVFSYAGKKHVSGTVRNIGRSCVTITGVFFALWGGQDIDLFVSFVGTFCCAPLLFVFPPYALWFHGFYLFSRRRIFVWHRYILQIIFFGVSVWLNQFVFTFVCFGMKMYICYNLFKFDSLDSNSKRICFLLIHQMIRLKFAESIVRCVNGYPFSQIGAFVCLW